MVDIILVANKTTSNRLLLGLQCLPGHKVWRPQWFCAALMLTCIQPWMLLDQGPKRTEKYGHMSERWSWCSTGLRILQSHVENVTFPASLLFLALHFLPNLLIKHSTPLCFSLEDSFRNHSHIPTCGILAWSPCFISSELSRSLRMCSNRSLSWTLERRHEKASGKPWGRC